MVAYLFPGQGSQQLGMGKDLFDSFKELTATADDILGYSIRDLCLKDPDSQLSLTKYTQPALYVVNAMSYLRLLEDGERPAFVAGHSLGEYNALLAAEVFDFATGLRLVRKRGELMAQARDGGMAAVLNKSEKEIRASLAEAGFDGIDIANLNAPAQVVVSGSREDVEKAEEIFKADKSCRYVRLPVSGAFHSRYMADAQQEFADFLDGFPLRAPKIPVVANVTARRYRSAEVKETLLAQITSAVKWSETVRYLLGRGEDELVEVGPGSVLTGLVTNIRRDAEPLVVTDDDDVQHAEGVPDTTSRGEATARASAPADEPEQPTTAKEAVADAIQVAARGSGDADVAVIYGDSMNGSRPADQVVIDGTELGSESFKRDYGLRYACVAGALGHGIGGADLIVAVREAGMLGFIGTLGLPPSQVETDLRQVAGRLDGDGVYGVNIVHAPQDVERDRELIELCLRYEVRVVEAAGYTSVTPALVRYRLSGARRDSSGSVVAPNRIIAKVSRPEVAKAFLSPAPAKIVDALVAENAITAAEAELAGELPVAADLCCEADSGGHTDQAVAFSLLPAMARLRDELAEEHDYRHPVRLGAAGGIGAPDAAAASFVLGADFVMTGSINQCTVEARTSELVKDMLEEINIQDTGYAPAGDAFELGGRVQVLRKGVLFPPRASKLYELYKRHESLDEIDQATAEQLQTRYFKKTFDEVYAEVRGRYPEWEIDKAEQSAKHRMALVFRWYFDRSLSEALAGTSDNRVDFQVFCGPALGAFNQWVKGTELEGWRQRRIGEINQLLLREAATLLNRGLLAVGAPQSGVSA